MPIVWGRVNDVFVEVVSGALSDAEFKTFLAALDETTRKPEVGVLVSTDETPLPAHQRKAIAELMDGRTNQVAVLTDSAIVRGVLTAIKWMMRTGNHATPFALRDVDRALDHLGVARDKRAEVIATLERLRAQISLPPLK